MISYFSELRYKEVIDIHTGKRLGYVCDAEFDETEGRLISLITPGKAKFFGLFGREDDYILPWKCIVRIGGDIILRRWNPKMAEYIYMERNGIYIIDLQKTVKKLEEAYNFVRDVAANGQSILFVGTKKQAAEAVKEEASRVGMYYVNARWLGGMLTNFKTMRTRIDRLAQLKKLQEDGTFDMLPKKEVMKHMGEMEKLEKYLGGVKEMKKLPGTMFVVDPRKEHNAIAEARKLHIPIVAIVDTNCDPDEVDYVIPANDDAIRAIRLIASTMANAVQEGRQGADAEVEETLAEAEAEKVEEE